MTPIDYANQATPPIDYANVLSIIEMSSTFDPLTFDHAPISYVFLYFSVPVDPFTTHGACELHSSHANLSCYIRRYIFTCHLIQPSTCPFNLQRITYNLI